MRGIPSTLISLSVRGLFLCFLSGCAYLGPRTEDTDSGTFRDDLELRTGRYRRRFLVHVPEDYTGSRSLPLVVVLHGAFSTAREMEQWSGWSELADREEFMVLYPEGIGILGFLQHWNAGHCCGKAVKDDWNDVAFIEAAIEGTGRKYSIDRRRIYMTGFSNGGMMTYRFAAERSSLLAAAASVAGAIHSSESQDRQQWRMPAPARPVPFLIMHGDSDKAVPYDGGRQLNRKSTREYRPVSDAAAFWIAANRSMAGPVMTNAFDGMINETSWKDANGGNEVRVYRIRDWGHTWPGGPSMKALPDDHSLKDFDAAEIIWRFFRQYPMD